MLFSSFVIFCSLHFLSAQLNLLCCGFAMYFNSSQGIFEMLNENQCFLCFSRLLKLFKKLNLIFGFYF